MKRSLKAVAVAIVLFLLGGVAFVYSGVYNVAATNEDSAVVRWLLHTTRERSIDYRAEGISSPRQAVLSDSETLGTGFRHYDEMCVACHGAPGKDPAELREGLNPQPPLLAEEAEDVSLQELFWVIKHGIKMTGMPAWGVTHSDDDIWAIAAFVKKLPEYSAQGYEAMRRQTADSHRH
jgi:mono/diheme cytochrome c family protein